MTDYSSDPNVVKQVQTAINAGGYQPALTVDGIYGPATQSGVMWFQGQHGLTQDGIIGDQTVAATVAPTPAQASALAAFQAQINALQSSGIPTPSIQIPPPGVLPDPGQTLTATPVIHLALVGVRPSAAVAPVPAAAPMTFPVAATAPSASGVPSWAGTVAGGALGLAGGFALGQLALGALVGAALGAGIDLLRKPATPTMHGEQSQMDRGHRYGIPGGVNLHHKAPRHHVTRGGRVHGHHGAFGMDYDESVIAGDMGCAAPSHTLRG